MIKNGEYVICKVCSKRFYERKSRLKIRKYCSHKCHNKDRIPLSKMHKRKLSKLRTGKNNPFYGKYHTEKNREKFKERIGFKNPHWKGGKVISNGYVYIYKPDHPFATKSRYVLEHRLVIEKHMERYLKPTEIIHHLNEIKDDNRLENLMYFLNESAHQYFHKLNTTVQHQKLKLSA